MVFEKLSRIKEDFSSGNITLMRSLLNTVGYRVVRASETDAEQDFSDRNLNKLHHVKLCPKVYNEQHFMSAERTELLHHPMLFSVIAQDLQYNREFTKF